MRSYIHTIYMNLIKIFVAVLITALLLSGCATRDQSRAVLHDPNYAALADTATTAAAMSSGGVELNPLGIWGTFVGKGIYLFGIRPGLDPKERAQADRWSSSVWYGAAANNLVQTMWAAPLIFSGMVGLMVGVSIYRDQPEPPK